MAKKYDFFKTMMEESKGILNEIDGIDDDQSIVGDLGGEGDVDFGGPDTEDGLGDEGGEGGKEENELTPEIIMAKLQELADEYGTDIEQVESMAMEALSKSEEEEGEEAPAEELGDLASEEAEEEPVEEEIPGESIPEGKKAARPVVEAKGKKTEARKSAVKPVAKK